MTEQARSCETDGCGNTAYGGKYCGDCLGGKTPLERGKVTRKDLWRFGKGGGPDAEVTRARLLQNGQPLRPLPTFIYEDVDADLRDGKYSLVATTPRRVFIAYAREFSTAAHAVHDFLRSIGHKPWIDSLDLESTAHLIPRLALEIEQSFFVVACISAGSLTPGRIVSVEIDEALERARASRYLFLVPIAIDGSTLPGTYAEYRPINYIASDALARLALTLNHAASDYVELE